MVPRWIIYQYDGVLAALGRPLRCASFGLEPLQAVFNHGPLVFVQPEMLSHFLKEVIKPLPRKTQRKELILSLGLGGWWLEGEGATNPCGRNVIKSI